jgi:tetratricopeptide (TPR) repeat protein
MSKSFHLGKLLAKSLSLVAIAGFVGFTPAALAIDPADDIGVFGSISVARVARDAAKAMKANDFPTASNLYRQSIANKGDFVDFYYGLLYCAQKAGQWDQVSAALDGLADKDPTAKPHLSFEYGHCYTNLGRCDEALPYLKDALAHVSTDGGFLIGKVKDLQTKTDQKAAVLIPGQMGPDGKIVPEPPKEPEKFVVPTREVIGADKLNPDATDTGRDYENAFRQSEWIGICEYRGFEKKDNIGFYNPPTANFYLVKRLKGPPSQKDLPLKFKFYDHAGMKPPDGWKFGPDKMPKPKSQWIIFIPNFVPIAGQGFDTYKGDYGRQEANEKNLGEIYSIIENHHGQTE